jgi:hypothetical protein
VLRHERRVDADQTRAGVEVEAMAVAPIPVPEVLWRRPPVVALAAVSGTALGCLGEPSTASAAAWAAAGAAARLQVSHVFVDGDEITGVIDWSEAGPGDAMYDLAALTLGHEERLGDVVAGYGTDVDLDVIGGWWSVRSLRAARWLIEHGFDPSSPGRESPCSDPRCEAVGASGSLARA